MTNEATQGTESQSATDNTSDIGAFLNNNVTQDAPVEQKVEAPKEDANERFARLAQLDRAQRAKDAELKSKYKELSAREAKIKDQLDLADLAEKNPLAYLKKKGFDLDKIYADSLNEREVESDPIRKELQELKEWKRSFEDREKERESGVEQQKSRELETKRADYLNHIGEFIKTNEEKFPLLSSFEDSNQKVYELIDTVYTESGGKKILKEEEACAEIQKELAEIYSKVLNKKGVRDLFKLGENKSDTSIESLLKPESGETIDQTFTSATSSESPSLSDEAERIKAATKLAEQIFRGQQG